MDLLLIVRKIWRHKLLTVPVILLTLAGAVYVVAVKEPLYEASSSYLLISPRAAPTAEEIARNPALAKVHADNPYTRFADQSVVVDVLERSMSTESARRTLMRAGADPRYTVGSGVEFGSSVPIMQINGPGSDPGGGDPVGRGGGRRGRRRARSDAEGRMMSIPGTASPRCRSRSRTGRG